MLHNGTQILFNYWRQIKGRRAAPTRVEIAPAAISQVLPSTFILQQNEAGQYEFRLAGTALCLLFGRELKAATLVDLLDENERRLTAHLLKTVQSEKIALQILLHAVSERGRDAYLECLVLPLDDAQPRLLGAIHIMDTPYWVGAEALSSVTLSAVRLLDAERDLISLHNRPAINLSTRKALKAQSARSCRFSVLQGGAMLSAPQAAQSGRGKSPPQLTLLQGGRDSTR